MLVGEGLVRGWWSADAGGPGLAGGPRPGLAGGPRPVLGQSMSQYSINQ